jgi:hypothetical protein
MDAGPFVMVGRDSTDMQNYDTSRGGTGCFTELRHST